MNKNNGREMLVKKEERKQMFLCRDFVESLSKGSYETHAKRISEMASKNIHKIVGENINTNVYPVCTFKKHAIVSDDFSNLYRLHFDESKNGLELSKVEKIDERMYTEGDVEGELEKDMADALSKSIDDPSKESEDSLREGLNGLLGFKTQGKHHRFWNFKNQ